jgi:nucleoside 2-deoxyribosyltransferase
MTEEISKLFTKATEGISDTAYEPMGYMAGKNGIHCILCRAHDAGSNAAPYYTLVYVDDQGVQNVWDIWMGAHAEKKMDVDPDKIRLTDEETMDDKETGNLDSGNGEEKAETNTPADIETDAAAGKRVYFAGPLFNESEKDFNLKMVEILEAHGYEVFLPQRDGFLATDLEGKTEEEKTAMIFEKDCSEVLKADILFMNLDGRVPDEGACVELGLAYANGKRCYGIKTDARSVELDLDINPMISECFIELFKNYDGDALVKELNKYLSENEL